MVAKKIGGSTISTAPNDGTINWDGLIFWIPSILLVVQDVAGPSAVWDDFRHF